MLSSIRKNLVILKDRKRRLMLMSAFFLMLAFLDMIGLGLISPFMMLIQAPERIDHFGLFGTLLKKPYDLIGLTPLTVLGIAVIVLYLLKNISAYLIQRIVIGFSYEHQYQLMNRLMRAYQIAPYEFHLNRNSAISVQTINSNTGAYIHTNLIPLVRLFSDLLLLVLIVGFLMVRYPAATLSMTLLLGGFGGGFLMIMNARITQSGRDSVAVANEMSKAILHAVRGFKEIRVLGKEKHFQEILGSKAKTYAHVNAVLASAGNIPRLAIEWLVIVLVVGFAIVSLRYSNTADVFAMLGTFGIAAVRLMPIVSGIVMGVNTIRFSEGPLDAVFNDLQDAEKWETEQKNKGIGSFASNSKVPEVFKLLEVNNVVFRYQSTTKAIINHLNLTLHQGEIVGIVGKSGSGKSTFIDLILGFLAPQAGCIKVNGRNIDGQLTAWLSQVAYIPQTTFLLDESLKANIVLGEEDVSDESHLWASIKMAQLEDVVRDLPNGLDTMVGEAGARLSGGQRQRIALARAFYHRRNVIIMDEATSALDSETESEVIQTISRLKNNKTIIMISHQMNSLRACDVIYRVENGDLVTHT